MNAKIINSQTQHTPGPWTTDSINQTTIWSSSGDGLIADCAEFLGFANARALPVQKRQANARLVAAAPELYEALRVIADSADRHSSHQLSDPKAYFVHISALARAALAKVTP